MHCVRQNSSKLVKYFIEKFNENKEPTEKDEEAKDGKEKEAKGAKEESRKGKDGKAKDEEAKDGKGKGKTSKEVIKQQEGKAKEDNKAKGEQKGGKDKQKKKVDVNAVDSYGRTVIHHVVSPLDFGSFENLELLKYLESKGAKLGIFIKEIVNDQEWRIIEFDQWRCGRHVGPHTPVLCTQTNWWQICKVDLLFMFLLPHCIYFYVVV